jgi:hypothetical protein
MTDRRAREILQLAEYLAALAHAVQSVQERALECGNMAAQLTEQIHVAQRRLRVLEHAASIVAPPVTLPDTEDEAPKQQH